MMLLGVRIQARNFFCQWENIPPPIETFVPGKFASETSSFSMQDFIFFTDFSQKNIDISI